MDWLFYEILHQIQLHWVNQWNSSKNTFKWVPSWMYHNLKPSVSVIGFGFTSILTRWVRWWMNIFKNNFKIIIFLSSCYKNVRLNLLPILQFSIHSHTCIELIIILLVASRMACPECSLDSPSALTEDKGTLLMSPTFKNFSSEPLIYF